MTLAFGITLFHGIRHVNLKPTPLICNIYTENDALENVMSFQKRLPIFSIYALNFSHVSMVPFIAARVSHPDLHLSSISSSDLTKGKRHLGHVKQIQTSSRCHC